MPKNNSLYLYAVIENQDIPDIQGIDNHPVYTIQNGDIAAVVSDLGYNKIRPERRHLSAHQTVFHKLMENVTPLPFAFGIIPEDKKAMNKVMAKYHDEFSKQLKYVSGNVEYLLNVIWNVPNIFDYFIFMDAELRDVRNQLFKRTQQPSVDEKIILGKLFEKKLNEKREEIAEQVEEILSQSCIEIKRKECKKENEALSLACLVSRDAQEKFIEEIANAAELFDNSYTFDYNGPWPPHHFVNLVLTF